MKKKYYGIVIDEDTKIIVLNSHRNLNRLSKELYDYKFDKIYIICGLWWTIETPKEMLKSIYIFFKNRVNYSKIKVTVLCNTKLELKLLKFIGVEAIYCNQNCFVDEKIFDINNSSEKKFNAVYNAVLSSFKRHYLAKDIEKLALITYNFSNKNYKKEIDDTLTHQHTWLNYIHSEEPVFLTNKDLAHCYNESYTGLALSKEEGAMYASNEYLLCGIPVVSTKSKGGRDVFYTKNNSIITNADEISVAKAVNELIERNLKPSDIRKETLYMMEEHRNRFCDLINKIMLENGKKGNIKETWDKWFVHKLRRELYLEDIISELKIKAK